MTSPYEPKRTPVVEYEQRRVPGSSPYDASAIVLVKRTPRENQL